MIMLYTIIMLNSLNKSFRPNDEALAKGALIKSVFLYEREKKSIFFVTKHELNDIF